MNIKISFIALSSRTTIKGTVPIYCVLSDNHSRVRFSTKCKIQPSFWDLKKQKARGNSSDASEINHQLEQLYSTIKDVIKKIQLSNEVFGLTEVLNELNGKGSQTHPSTLMAVYKHKFEKMHKLLGQDYTQSTLSKYSQMAKAVQDFINAEYQSKDILLKKLNRPFLDDLELFLRTNKAMKPISSNKVIQGLKSVVIYALERDWIAKNPFIGHSFKKVDTEIKYLTKEQIDLLEQTKLSQQRLEQVKELFLFSIYTGLHYADAMSLTDDNLVVGIDGKAWISYVRSKTGKRIQIPLLDKAQALLIKFKTTRNIQGFLLPRISNQKMNSYLKEVADILKIDMILTHKIARKTFGSILLYHNVPIKVVSELMGHSNSLITERHYAKLDTRKLGEAMKLLE